MAWETFTGKQTRANEWRVEDDAEILRHDLPDAELAELLGRTEKAIRSRRARLSQHVLGVPVDGSVVLAPGEVITDPDRAEQLGLTADARRMRREQGE